MSSKKDKNQTTDSKTSFDVVNQYGTYNIQPTNGTENDYPQIAQGLPKQKKKNKK